MTVFDPLQHPIAFHRPERLAQRGPAQEHIPFEMALVDTLRPKSLVYLGVGTGDVYFGYCQAIKALGGGSQFLGIDAWGDEARGLSGNPETPEALRSYHDPLYGRFSRLIDVGTLDALPTVADRSVDLFHMDCRISFEAAKRTLDSWLPKTSDRGLMLLNNTRPRESSTGSAQLWSELKAQYPHFEFYHGGGLGILGVGRTLPPEVAALFSMDEDRARWVRGLFFSVGSRLSAGVDRRLEVQRRLEALPLATQDLFLKDHPDGGTTPTATARRSQTLPVDDGSRGSVSVVILNYNGNEDLRICLESLHQLDFPKERLEIIVVDNGSTDSSVDMVRRAYPDTHLICNENNVGFSRAANQAAARSKSRYLAFLNNDMRVDQSWLKHLTAAIEEADGPACVGSVVMNWEGTQVQYAGRREDLFSLGFMPPTTAPVTNAGLQAKSQAMFASGGAMLIRRNVFVDLGGFDEDYFMYHEDVDLGWRMWLRGHKITLCPDSIVYHKGSASSRRLSFDYVNLLQQRNMLLTTFQNLESHNLASLFPLLFCFLLERSRRWPPARDSLEEALQALKASLAGAVMKRSAVQKSRQMSDAELFALVGNPFSFLLREPAYAGIREEMLGRPPLESLDFESVSGARAAIGDWLEAAHFAFERGMLAASDRIAEAGATLEWVMRFRSWKPVQIVLDLRRRMLRGNPDASH